MPSRYPGLAIALFALSSLAPAQTGPPAAKSPARSWKVPCLDDGKPDFQGVWANNNATPLERPKDSPVAPCSPTKKLP